VLESRIAGERAFLAFDSIGVCAASADGRQRERNYNRKVDVQVRFAF
jgi:hypothetical protein